MNEAVELCPHCMEESIYPNWDKSQGYKARCTHCRAEIMLCGKCLHTEDNKWGRCDWRETETGGVCFRGETKITDN